MTNLPGQKTGQSPGRAVQPVGLASPQSPDQTLCPAGKPSEANVLMSIPNAQNVAVSLASAPRMR